MGAREHEPWRDQEPGTRDRGVVGGADAGQRCGELRSGSSAPGGASLDTDDFVTRWLPDGRPDPTFGVGGAVSIDHAEAYGTVLRSIEGFTNFIVTADAITIGSASINRNSGQTLFTTYRVLGSEPFSNSFE